jgi:serine-type anaerobic sulfatase-maturating enzyme
VEPRYKLGNIKELPLVELVALPQQRQFGLDNHDTRRSTASTATCASPATAAAPRTASSTGDPGLNYLCAGYKDFFHHVDRPMRIMGQLLAQGRAASEIVQLYAAEDAKRGRKDPCTCGSGRKWKRCHGD